MWPELAYISDSILSCVNAGTKYIVINVISGHGPDKQETPSLSEFNFEMSRKHDKNELSTSVHWYPPIVSFRDNR